MQRGRIARPRPSPTVEDRGHIGALCPIIPDVDRGSLLTGWSAVALAALAACALGGCSTGHPSPISSGELQQAQTFPYYRIYWVGHEFAHEPLTAADGQKSYNAAIGDSVYYGDCVGGKGILQTGTCRLPLQVTTVIYQLHLNSNLGTQSNMLIRGVPATVYEGGRAIELYSGPLAIDIFSNSPSRAMRAALQLRPLNAPGSPLSNLPPPVFCPGLSGAVSMALQRVMNELPGHVCQVSAERIAVRESLKAPVS